MSTAVRPLRALCAVGALCVLCGSVVKNWGLLLFIAGAAERPRKLCGKKIGSA